MVATPGTPPPIEETLRHPREKALEVAQRLTALMHPYVERIEVAGSIRRLRPDVKDIELVLIPKPYWHTFTDKLLEDGHFEKRHAWGAVNRFAVHVRSGINVDMFCCTEANWGATLHLRTGPGDLNTKIMTWLKHNPNAPIRSEGGFWWHGEHKLRTPEEQDFFDLFGIPFVRPDERCIETYRALLNDPAREWPDFSRWGIHKPQQQKIVDAPAQVNKWSEAELLSQAVYRAESDMRIYGGWFESGAKEVTQERIDRVLLWAKQSQNPKTIAKTDEWAAYWLKKKGLKGAMMLKIDVDDKLKFNAEEFAGQRVVILGVSGAGKTNTSGVLIEELLPFLKMTILDIEGEHWGLAENHDILIVGRSDHSVLDVSTANAGALAKFVYEQQLSVILDMSDHDEDEMFAFVHDYFTSLWNCAFRVKVGNKQPYGIVIEEMQEFIPQTRNSPVKDLFKRYAKRGRKQGFTLIMTSQESQDVDKRVITQANIAFLHRVTHPNDKAVYKKYIPWKPSVVDETVSELKPGQAIVVSGSEPVTAQIRKRHAFHAGLTPSLSTPVNTNGQPALRKIDEALLEKLNAALSAKANIEPSPDGQRAVRLAELERENAALQKALEEVTHKESEIVKSADNLHDELEQKVRDVTKERDTLKLKLATVEAERDRARGEYNADLKRFEDIHKSLTEVMRKFEAIEGLVDSLDAVATTALVTSKRNEYRIKEAVETPEPTDTDDDLPDNLYRSERLVKLAQDRQRRSLERVTDIVRNQAPANKQAFQALVDNPGKALTVNELARLTGYSPTTFRLNPLVELGLLTRRGRGRYQSKVDEHVTREYPDLDTEDVLASLAK